MHWPVVTEEGHDNSVVQKTCASVTDGVTSAIRQSSTRIQRVKQFTCS